MKAILTLITAIVVLVTPTFAQKEIKSIHGNATMFVNGEYQPREFAKLLLITGSIDQETNKKIQGQFQKMGVPTVTSLEVMPPVKEYTDEEVKVICEKNNVDGIVQVKITGQEKSNARALAQTLYNLEVTVIDLKSNLNAANFIGTSSSMKLDKAIHDYFRAIMEELRPIVTQ